MPLYRWDPECFYKDNFHRVRFDIDVSYVSYVV